MQLSVLSENDNEHRHMEATLRAQLKDAVEREKKLRIFATDVKSFQEGNQATSSHVQDQASTSWWSSSLGFSLSSAGSTADQQLSSLQVWFSLL